MRRNMILIFGVLILIGCREQKEQVVKFIFDASKMSRQIDYFYSYDSNRLLSQTEKTYTIMFGQVVDSMITNVDFEYNDKGLLIKETSRTDFEDKPTIRIYDYNLNDSLISDISINQENDTTLWEVYKYYPDGRKTMFHRFLIMHLDPNQDLMEAMENKQLDTSFYRNEFEYAGDLCKTQKQFDKKGNLIKTVNFDYNGTQLIKETHLTYFNGMEMTEKIKTYDYSKSETRPDYYSVDSNNDTLELCISAFSDGHLATLTEVYEYGRNINKTFFKNGKEIGMVGVDLNMNFKIVDSYEYYENGELKVIKTYNEQINNAH